MFVFRPLRFVRAAVLIEISLAMSCFAALPVKRFHSFRPEATPIQLQHTAGLGTRYDGYYLLVVTAVNIVA